MNWNGKYYKGAMKARKEIKRQEAEERNAKTPDRKRAAYRRSHLKIEKH